MTFRQILDLLTWNDLVDVVVVAVLIYSALLLIRGTRAVQMVLGLLVLAGVYYLARIAHLATLQTLIENFLIFLPFAMIVLFQQEIRRGLASVGGGPLWRLHARPEETAPVADIALAAENLARRGFGALVVLERREGLRNVVENGIAVDGRLSFDLLVTIFSPDTPLHDGAVVVQRGRIAAAACFLPLSSNPELARDLGTRHRAALGISEETDAVAVVVSEETQEISLALDGHLERALSPERLRTRLAEALAATSSDRGTRAPRGATKSAAETK